MRISDWEFRRVLFRSLAYGRDTSDAGAAAKDITITTTLGIAERLYQRLENYGNAGDGLIPEEIHRLSAQNLDPTDKLATRSEALRVGQACVRTRRSR